MAKPTPEQVLAARMSNILDEMTLNSVVRHSVLNVLSLELPELSHERLYELAEKIAAEAKRLDDEGA